MTPEASAKMGDEVVRISYHRRMYGLGEVRFGSYLSFSFILLCSVQQSAISVWF